MRHVFIINPAAGQKKSARRLEERVEAAFRPGEYRLYYTQKAGDACALARQAVEEAAGEPVRIYACGGDGTLNEVVNGAAGHPNAAVTNVPMGTGNDFLRIFGRENREKFNDLAALRCGPQVTMDLMDCNGLLGINTVCCGIDARVAVEVHNYKRIPFIGKKLAYILSLVVNVFKGITWPMEVDMGPHRREGPTAIVCVCNGQYYGGGFHPMPEAVPSDGVLDMLMLGDVSLPKLARFVGKYSHGRYQELPREIVRSWHGDEVRLSSPREMAAVVDGETLWGKEFTIRLSEKKLDFFWPVGVAYPAAAPQAAAAAR